MHEIQIKLERLRGLMRAEGLDGIFLTKKNHFAWLTGGKDCHIETVAESGAAKLLVTMDNQYLLTNNIEAGRLYAEEVNGLEATDSGCAGVVFTPLIDKWYAPEPCDLLATGKWGADADVAGMVNLAPQLQKIRGALLPEEIERYRWLGRNAAEVLENVCRAITKGETEHSIGARLAAGLMERGITPYVTLVASDERIFNFRHPIPVDKKVEGYVMVVTCAERWGLIANATRFVRFGQLPEELRAKLQAALEVEATLICATKPGKKVGDIFAEGMAAYERVGYPLEWEKHHQGGPTGYAPRDYVAVPGCAEVVQENQAFAWNPSITGVKTEDTVLVTKDGFEWLTKPGDWPTIKVNYGGQEFLRPDILSKEE